MNNIQKALAAFAVAVCAVQVEAVPITYTFSGEVSGNLDGVSFVGKSWTVVLEGDTDNVTPATPGAPSFNTARISGLTGTFAIDDVGAGNFTDPLRAYKSSSLVGFGDNSDIFYLFWSDSYDLTTEVAALGLTARRQNNPVNTDLGILNITAATTGSFSAALVQAEVPEPASLALLGLGMLGLGASRHLQSRKAM